MIKYMPIEEAKSIYLINGRYHGSLGSYPIVQDRKSCDRCAVGHVAVVLHCNGTSTAKNLESQGERALISYAAKR